MGVGKIGGRFMVRFLLNFLIVFLLIISFSFADTENNDAKLEAKLQKEYGYALTHVPFFLRFAYFKTYDKPWTETDYPERKAYLADYELNVAAEKAKEKAEAKAAADDEKKRILDKKEAQRKEKDRLKALKAQKKEEKDIDLENQKAFDQSVQKQKKILDQMKRNTMQHMNQSP
jgi:hypothetical protein